jgi:hypothetical protein
MMIFNDGMEDAAVGRAAVFVIRSEFDAAFVEPKKLEFCANKPGLRAVINFTTPLHLASHAVCERQECRRPATPSNI